MALVSGQAGAGVGILVEEEGGDEEEASSHIAAQAHDHNKHDLVVPPGPRPLEQGEEHSVVLLFLLFVL